MNEPENQIFKSEILKKKEHEDDLFFFIQITGKLEGDVVLF